MVKTNGRTGQPFHEKNESRSRWEEQAELMREEGGEIRETTYGLITQKLVSKALRPFSPNNKGG